VSESPDRQDVWRFPALLLWLLFFIVGLAPEPVYYLLRQAGGVVPQYAIVNSPQALTVGFAAYLAVFSLNRCRAAGLSLPAAQDRALLVGVLGLAAFLPVDFLRLIQLYLNPETQGRLFVYLNYAAAAVKVAAWWYLLSVMVRYYLGAEDAFAEIPSIFPSSGNNKNSLKVSSSLSANGQSLVSEERDDDSSSPGETQK